MIAYYGDGENNSGIVNVNPTVPGNPVSLQNAAPAYVAPQVIPSPLSPGGVIIIPGSGTPPGPAPPNVMTLPPITSNIPSVPVTTTPAPTLAVPTNGTPLALAPGTLPNAAAPLALPVKSGSMPWIVGVALGLIILFVAMK